MTMVAKPRFRMDVGLFLPYLHRVPDFNILSQSPFKIHISSILSPQSGVIFLLNIPQQQYSGKHFRQEKRMGKDHRHSFHPRNSQWRITARFAIMLILSGCTAVGPDYVTPEPSMPDRWHGIEGKRLREKKHDQEQWW
jgi:hypothetical protein